MKGTFLLVHSPLAGPLTWEPLRAELARRGRRVVVPSLLPALEQARDFAAALSGCVTAALAQAGERGPLVWAAHSAAGFFTPALAAPLRGRIRAYLFVDATLPPDLSPPDLAPPDRGAAGQSPARGAPPEGRPLASAYSGEEFARLRGMAREGRLPPWSAWFPAEAYRAVLPDPGLRRRFLAEVRPVPLALFEEPVAIPPGWPDAPCAYLRLSEFYHPALEQARVRGWPTAELPSCHLHMLVDPPAVADALLALLRQAAT